MPGETLAVCGDQENPDWDQQAANAMVAALVNEAVQTEATPVIVAAPAPTNS